MRFSDITLDGLISEFEKISKAQSDNSEAYTLPQDLLDQPDAVADVPFYEELLKSTASARSELYGVVSDSEVLTEAHPNGPTKLMGMDGVEVKDLKAIHSEFEKMLNSQVKAKKAALFSKMVRFAAHLSEAGLADLSAIIDKQVLKLAGDWVTYPDEPGNKVPLEMEPDDHIKEAVNNYSTNLEMILGAIEFNGDRTLAPNMRATLTSDKARVQGLLNDLVYKMVANDAAGTMTILKAITEALHKHIKAAAEVPVVAKLLPGYKAAFAKLRDIAVAMKSSAESDKAKTRPVSEQVGVDKVYQIKDIFENRLMEYYDNDLSQYSGTNATSFRALDKDLRKYFKLYPSNVTNIPAGGDTYKNWDELAQKVEQRMRAKELHKRNKAGLPAETPVTTKDLPLSSTNIPTGKPAMTWGPRGGDHHKPEL